MTIVVLCMSGQYFINGNIVIMMLQSFVSSTLSCLDITMCAWSELLPTGYSIGLSSCTKYRRFIGELVLILTDW